MKYTALDFEVGNASLISACSVGISVFEDFQPVKRFGCLIRPPFAAGAFHWGNVRVHGIRREDVEHAPLFDEVWPELAPHLEDSMLICHNAAFDTAVLCACLDHFQLPYPHCEYLCTVKVARAVWPNLENHRLNTLADALGIALEHHEAGSDAHAAGLILLQALRETGCGNAGQLAQKLGIQPGILGGASCMTEQERHLESRTLKVRRRTRRRHHKQISGASPVSPKPTGKGDCYDERVLDRPAEHRPGSPESKS